VRRTTLAAAVLVMTMACGLDAVHGAPAAPPDLPHILTQLVQREDTATMAGDRRALASLFVPDNSTAAVAREQAEQRLNYLQAWAKARRIAFDRVRVRLRTGRVIWTGSDTVRIYAADSAQYFYHHLVGHTASQWFGLGVYHWYTIRRVGPSWYLLNDVFIDPLNQDTRLTGAAQPATIRVPPERQQQAVPSPGARRALEYAAQYCGAAPGCGNDNRYNPRFGDYNWRGGDCTDFISQVLWAGGFPQTPAWHWNPGAGDGSVAWVNAPALVSFLERTHRVSLIAEGTMPTMLEAKSGRPAPLHRLRLGDLIAYDERGRVVHMAIVAGFDVDGYPVVMSHSADRYREPWDLGWDRTTRFMLFHVNYPPPAPVGRANDHTSPRATTAPVTASSDRPR
jgi:hypothetical protein